MLLNTLVKRTKVSPRRAFTQQRTDAKARGIQFRLTWQEWLAIWSTSGHLHERGPRKGQYVMARIGDRGAYEVGNVRIVLCEQNHRDAAPQMLGIRKSKDHKQKISEAAKGRILSLEHRAKIGLAHRDKPKGPMKEETKRKISAARQRWLANRKREQTDAPY